MNNVTFYHFSLLNVGHGRHNADWNWQNVCSPFARVFYVVNGEARIDYERSSLVLQPGCLYLIPPFVRHGYHCDGEFELVYVHLYETCQEPRRYDDMANRLFDSYDLPFSVQAQPADEMLLFRLCSLWPDLALRHSNPVTYDNADSFIDTVRRRQSHARGDVMETSGILLQIMSRFMSEAVAKPICSNDRMIKAITYVHRHLDRPIGIDDIARHMCVSKNHCIRLFNTSLGLTPAQYVNNKKIERSQLLLITTGMSIKDISSSVGYDDCSYFCRIFRKTVGLTPAMFRTSAN